jgi:uncharacterized protein (TIGR02145 family)
MSFKVTGKSTRTGPGRIGSQVWMLRNLDVTTYRNGDPIPQVTDATEWAGLTTGAWSYYNNDPANGVVYGKLYNWYAVNDSRGLAPTGWHVPSDTEWTTLTDYLGGESVAGGPMKEVGTTHWTAPNTGATNSSGFTGFAGGTRFSNGAFYNIGINGSWWSSTEYSSTDAWYRYLYFSTSNVYRISLNKANGYFVRCIKD